MRERAARRLLDLAPEPKPIEVEVEVEKIVHVHDDEPEDLRERMLHRARKLSIAIDECRAAGLPTSDWTDALLGQ